VRLGGGGEGRWRREIFVRLMGKMEDMRARRCCCMAMHINNEELVKFMRNAYLIPMSVLSM
jgi:hypothetical protein